MDNIIICDFGFVNLQTIEEKWKMMLIIAGIAIFLNKRTLTLHYSIIIFSLCMQTLGDIRDLR